MRSVIGVETVAFTPKDATEKITGVAIYLAHEIPAEMGTGLSVERHFLSTAKMVRLGIDPDTLIGKTVRVSFNHYGKIFRLEVVDN
ncbi:MAG: hypothetical protein IJJ85_10555 [Clostridia bacterium]|nr:hypothetical protein [Oscillospiraceae bacterium]MBR0510547.1 hypothetical protein [Clostridia bacterium]